MSQSYESIVTDGAVAYVRLLAAAEVAILRGQFNAAKVLRSLAYSRRTQAMNASREHAEEESLERVFQWLLSGLQAELSYVSREEQRLVLNRALDVATRSVNSLTENPDIPEWTVNQLVNTCIHCGNIVEGAKPERCDVCGVLSTEFVTFGPFYGASAEHLGQLMPNAIVDILKQTPEHLESLLASADDEVLAAKPSPQEWSVKELMGHLIETDANFVERMETLRHRSRYAQTLPPWKLHEGKGYDARSGEELLGEFRMSRRRVLDYVSSLTDEDWAHAGTLLNETRTLVDTGTWLANHDRSHIAQIERMLDTGQRML